MKNHSDFSPKQEVCCGTWPERRSERAVWLWVVFLHAWSHPPDLTTCWHAPEDVAPEETFFLVAAEGPMIPRVVVPQRVLRPSLPIIFYRQASTKSQPAPPTHTTLSPVVNYQQQYDDYQALGDQEKRKEENITNALRSLMNLGRTEDMKHLALKAIDRGELKDVNSWNLALYATRAYSGECLQVYEAMKSADVAPDVVSFTFVFESLQYFSRMAEAKEVAKDLESSRVKPNKVIYQEMMRLYIKNNYQSGLWPLYHHLKALRIRELEDSKKGTSQTTPQKDSEEEFSMLRERDGWKALDASVMSFLIDSLGRMMKPNLVHEILKDIKACHLGPTSDHYSCAIRTYLTFGKGMYPKVGEVFKMMEEERKGLDYSICRAFISKLRMVDMPSDRCREALQALGVRMDKNGRRQRISAEDRDLFIEFSSRILPHSLPENYPFE
ncbi:putative pentatricopeptide repeat-containing protein [Planoprotostelium fungivorum]|uniref:Putative pentatricopeptide repeat-containing protein n=1 Tax=Planoprotostelium fungivorum TaxID=1890364 RepID=A0A2P6MXY6_9EUKA|nr:putative pentatricopeptide repeat-containing protein [Planoprotostelium fungivorum]